MTKQITKTTDPRRMRLRFHYEVDRLGKRIAVWSEDFEEKGERACSHVVEAASGSVLVVRSETGC